MATKSLIGIDVGTTALKAVLIDASGQQLAGFKQSYAISRPSPGTAEQNPADWMQAVMAALESFQRDHDLSGLRGIGICSQVNTHVFVDDRGDPILPAIVWQDARAAPEARILDAQVTHQQKVEWFGGPVPIDASHALARMAHVRRVAPELYAATRHVLLPKDYCVMHLTGDVGSDAISAVGLVNASGYVEALLDLVPGAAQLLPPLHGFSHVAGKVRDGLPCAGVPVVVGAMDAWGGMFGVGVVNNGDAMLQCGTSEIPGIVSSKVKPTTGVVLFPAYDGITMHAAPTQSGGAALAWFGNVLGRPVSDLSTLAESISPSAAVPVFLPHLQGERAPLWDSASRGVFARIDARAGAAEMVRSVMEGVAFSVRLAFGALQQSADIVPQVVNLGGGGANSDIWCQIRADALGKTLRRVAVPDAAAVGAAILAGLGSGIMDSLPAAVKQLVRFDKEFEPDPAYHAYYEEKFERYLELYEALRPLNSRY